MAQLIASNQLTLTNIIDGKSSYTHIAYAWSADGTDRFTTVYPRENFIANSSFKNGLNNWSTNWWMIDTNVTRNGNPTAKGTFTDASSSAKAFMQAVSTNGLSENDDVVWSVWAKSDNPDGQLHLELWGSVYRADKNVGTEWTRINIKGKLKSSFNVYIWNTKAGTYWISEPKLEKGIELTPYVPAPSEDYINAYPRYMGNYIDYTEEDSLNPSDYTWTRILGEGGADGLPTYIHWAYSDNADGTGLTTSDNGQRYIGQYSDNIKTDSMDKTKYRWADRWAKIEVGGKNILRNSSFANAYDGPERFTVGGITYVNKRIPNYNNLYNSGIPNPTTSYHAIYRESFNGKGPVIEFNESNGGQNWKAITAILQPSNLSFGNYTFSADIYATGNGTKIWFGFYYFNKSGVRGFHSGQTTIYITKVNEWHRVSGAIKLNNDIDLTKEVNLYIYAYGFTTNSILYLTKPQLEEGTVTTPYGVSPEDIQADIASKADQALTQQQINALNEKNQILEAEMKAKASMEAFSELEKTYQSFVKANADGQAKAEADLVEAGRRIEMLTTQFGGLAELKTFIDTYMSSSNEGLIIGKNDASSTIKVSSDRISMFSAGKEVMYISQGVININNGIFTVSVQIGKFRTEQYHLNADMNVIRYVG